jgi:hypothetical protein
MPIHQENGGEQWGQHGKVYHGPDAKEKAEKQAAAAHAHGYKGDSEEIENIRAIRDAVPRMPEFLRREIDADIARREREHVKKRSDDMPYTEQQHKLFEAAAHDPEIAKRKDIPQATAKRLANEGVKGDNSACTDSAKKRIRVKWKKST